MPPIQGFFAQSTLLSLTIDRDSGETDFASGFFYEHNGHYYVVTNRHVLEITDNEDISSLDDLHQLNPEYPDELFVYIRYDPLNPTNVSREKVDLFDSNGDPLWIEHPNSDVDVIAIPLRVDLSVTHSKPYSKSNFVPSDVEILGGDSAMAIGYPKGLYDSDTYFPVIRDGLIATPPHVDYKNLPVFLMDAKMHGGTSGSPVLTQPSPLQRTQSGISMMSGTPAYLLGIHSGPEYAPLPRDGTEEYDPNLDLNMVWHVEVLEELLDQA
ncbi:S1 family peptidase [Natronorubrum aibiense]|uniref:Serine protease n=1 Tax=Natronorubrum aibiense TaxID=348826 RepID=A0A5P9P5P9_9EURY|nr:serine protease [Natronorubrum aibiense]QFU83396.1 hypothetical protein GCU68_13020 [Natronorubrum aibiense]